MESYKSTLLPLFLVIVAIFAFGTLGFYVIEDGWSIFDAFYMVVISVTTVGFGEVHPLSPPGRVFAILVVLSGFGVAASALAKFTQFIVEGELNGFFRRRKMSRRIKNIRGHYIVCGHGRTGETICLKLFEMDIPFVVIDTDPKIVELAEQRGYIAVIGNAGSDMVLLSAAIERAAGIVISCSDDGTVLLIELAARELNPDIHIIALGNYPTNEARMLRAGADKVIYPLRLGGEQIARLIAKHCGVMVEGEIQTYGRHDVMGYDLKLYRHFDVTPVSIATLIRRFRGLHAVCCIDVDGNREEMPNPDTLIELNETVVMLVSIGSGVEEVSPEAVQDLEWSDELRLGINLMDDDHRGLVIMINRFARALRGERGKNELADVFDKLLNYTVTHFEKEEELMRVNEYPELAAHVAEHRRLTQSVMALNKDRRCVFPSNVIYFLNNWLVSHVLETDRSLAEYLRDRGVV